MRNPNSYGSVIKLSGKRRHPFAVRITSGWTDKGKQIYKYLGYYKTRQEAMIELASYNAKPYDVDMHHSTFEEIFEKWSDQKFPTLSHQSVSSYSIAFKHLKPLHKLKMTEIRTRQLQEVFDNCNKGSVTKNNMKIVCNQVFTYSIKHDIIEKNYARYIELGKKDEKRLKQPFTRSEIADLWSKVDNTPNIDLALILIYTGTRPSELLKMKTENIHLEKRYMQGGIKTKAGKNRIIPINEKIYPLIKKRYNKNNDFLVIVDEVNKEVTYSIFKKRWNDLNLNHSPHECRHTFASLMDSAGANKVSTKKIMGHTTQDMTDGVYTHKTINELIKAVNMI